MSKKTEKANVQPDLSVNVVDERLQIPLELEGKIVHTLYFNPSDYHIYEHMLALEKFSKASESMKLDENDLIKSATKMKDIGDEIDYHFDGIFGEGAARIVFKYTGYREALRDGLIDKVRIGIEWYNKQADEHRKKEDIEARKQAMKQSKNEKANFIAKK